MRVHDLLWASDSTKLRPSPQPDWVREAFAQCPVVVVRRAEAPRGFVAVGVRGANRSQRYAALLDEKNILHCKTPESLVSEALWRKPGSGLSDTLIETLRQVSEAAQKIGLTWGPVGSVGFQLATTTASTNPDSDLDVLVRCTDSLNGADLHHLYTAIQATFSRVDVVLESSDGAVSLADYLQNSHAMVKTNAGPRLAHFSW